MICELCFHRCDLSEGQTGFCRARACRDGEIVSKKELMLPKELKNIIRCKNPRCITSIEQGLPHIFVLADEKKEIYRCKYCEEKCTDSLQEQSPLL